jgi:hypothetical protein
MERDRETPKASGSGERIRARLILESTFRDKGEIINATSQQQTARTRR